MSMPQLCKQEIVMIVMTVIKIASTSSRRNHVHCIFKEVWVPLLEVNLMVRAIISKTDI